MHVFGRILGVLALTSLSAAPSQAHSFHHAGFAPKGGHLGHFHHDRRGGPGDRNWYNLGPDYAATEIPPETAPQIIVAPAPYFPAPERTWVSSGPRIIHIGKNRSTEPHGRLPVVIYGHPI